MSHKDPEANIQLALKLVIAHLEKLVTKLVMNSADYTPHGRQRQYVFLVGASSSLRCELRVNRNNDTLTLTDAIPRQAVALWIPLTH